MLDFLMGFLIPIAIGLIILLIILLTKKKKLSSTSNIPTSITPITPTSTSNSKKSIFWKVVERTLLIITTAVIIIWVCSFFLSKEKREETPAPIAQVVGKELMAEGIVGDQNWITPSVNYKFKVKSEGHSFFVQFSSSKGGWTEKQLIPTEGDITLIISSEAIQGPLKITAGPKETRNFRVQLYKIK